MDTLVILRLNTNGKIGAHSVMTNSKSQKSNKFQTVTVFFLNIEYSLFEFICYLYFEYCDFQGFQKKYKALSYSIIQNVIIGSAVKKLISKKIDSSLRKSCVQKDKVVLVWCQCFWSTLTRPARFFLTCLVEKH